jgi:putative toxin-antitoxin system antitoxin component (TIGR02293 family)
MMDNTEKWTVSCLDPQDGSGDLIVNLPNELLQQMALEIGDRLKIEVAGGLIMLTPVGESVPSQVNSPGNRKVGFLSYRSCLEHLLHIPVDATDQQIHETIESGFTANDAEALLELGILNVDVQTKLSCGQCLSISENDYLFKVVHVISLAEAFFGDLEKAKRWLSKPKSQFSGKTPFEMLSTTPGTRRVEELLAQGTEGMTL